MNEPANVLRELARVVQSRHDNRPAESYTTQLFEAGHSTISAKVIEEAYELIATLGEDETGSAQRAETIHEAADLVYHVLVLLTSAGVDWTDVEQELVRRFGHGGLARPRS